MNEVFDKSGQRLTHHQVGDELHSVLETIDPEKGTVGITIIVIPPENQGRKFRVKTGYQLRLVKDQQQQS